jgi:hypothetical protein
VIAASHASVVLTLCVHLPTMIKAGANDIPRGAQCIRKQRLVPAASCVLKFRVNHSGVGVCHCLACQRRTGSVFAALASFAAPYKVFGTATEYVRVGDQGAKFKFRFCPVCGTTVFHTEEGHEQSSVAVAVGAFADPRFPPPKIRSMTVADTLGVNYRQG